MFEFWFICFTVTAYLLPPHRQLQPGTGPQNHSPHSAPRVCQTVTDRRCLTPAGTPPELQLEQGRQQPPAPAQELNKQQTPSPGHDKVEPFYSSSGKVLFSRLQWHRPHSAYWHSSSVPIIHYLPLP